MSKTFSKKPLALALGAAFALTGVAAQASVFQVSDLASGYMVASADDKGGEKAGEASCGAKCVEKMTKAGKSDADAKAACDKAKKEGKCGGEKKAKKEGKCGEAKCGGKK